MSKLYSGGLLLTLMFSTAHAPTFQLWRGHQESHGEVASAAPLIAGARTPWNAELAGVLPRNLAEDDEIMRFQLDDFYLPTLDVSLPTLFDWSDSDREFLADLHAPLDASFVQLDHGSDSAFPSASMFGSAGVGIGSFGRGMSASLAAGRRAEGQPAIQSLSGSESSASGAASKTDSQDTNAGSPGSNQAPPDSDGSTPSNDNINPPGDVTPPVHDSNTVSQEEGETSPTDETKPADLPSPIYSDVPSSEFPITTTPPVQVPAPGTFGLLALGLAGLRLAGRKKNRSG